jgi:Mce-associated membrane protein
MSASVRWLLTVVGVLFAVAVVGLAAVGGYVYWDRVETVADKQTRDTLPALAIDQVPKIFAFDYQTVEATLNNAALLLTDDYKAEFENRAQTEIIPQARDRQLVTQANVVGAGMLDAHRDTGSVLVFLNRTVTDKTKQPVYDGSRLRVDYAKQRGEWKIKYITPI